MFAIFEDGGRQYKVSEGDNLLIDLKDIAEGQKEVTFSQVLMVGEGAGVKIGAPFIAGASVTATIVAEDMKLPKVTGIKFNRRKGYKKKWGHRQRVMRLKIAGIRG